MYHTPENPPHMGACAHKISLLLVLNSFRAFNNFETFSAMDTVLHCLRMKFIYLVVSMVEYIAVYCGNWKKQIHGKI